MQAYPSSAVEKAMKTQEVILRAMSGRLSWLQAEQILGCSARTLRRLRWKYKRHGYDGLLDRRTGRPSPKRASMSEVERILKLYREHYEGYNLRHFHEIAEREHGVKLSYSFVKQLLREAGLVRKRRARGKHRLKREPKGCVGEMLHLDGSPHAWLALVPGEEQHLIASVDDATSRVLYARLEPEESTRTVMIAMKTVVEKYGIPMSWYMDRASWAFFTPKANGPVDKKNLTQVGRALARLGVEQIPAYSPQARGRSERLNRTFQDRLVNELKTAGIRTTEAANRYLDERFVGHHNELFARPPRDPHSVFVSAGSVDLDQIFCEELTRTVGKDNTVVLKRVRLQIPQQPGRATCAGRKVLVRKHLNGLYSIWRGVTCWGRYDPEGRLISDSGGRPHPAPAQIVDRRGKGEVEKTLSRPDLALSTPLPRIEGRDRWLHKSPGLSPL